MRSERVEYHPANQHDDEDVCFHCGQRGGWFGPVDGLEGKVECRSVQECERRITAALAHDDSPAVP